MHLKTIRNRRRVQAQLDRPLRDATEAEICQEPDVVLEALISGAMFATWMTRQYAISELERRRGDRADVYEKRPFDQEAPDVAVVARDLFAPNVNGPYDQDAARATLLRLIDPDVEAPAALRRAKQAYDERTAS